MTTAKKLPPQDLDAERGVLGSVLLANDYLHEVLEVLGPKPEVFYLDAHRRIFEAILHLQAAKVDAFDPVTVSEVLEKSGKLREIGGDEYLHELIATVPYAAHARSYAEIVLEHWHRRLIVIACGDALRAAYDGAELDGVLQTLETAALHVLQGQAGARSMSLGDALRLAWDGLMDAKTHSAMRLMTGFTRIDQIIGGFRGGNLVILAARPGMGKTSLAIQIALYAGEQGMVLVFSFEQTAEELAQRVMSSQGSVPLPRIRNGTTFAADETKLAQICCELNETKKLTINDQSTTVTKIAAAVRMAHRKGTLALVVIDYLQLIEPEDRRQPREQQVSSASRALKKLAMECKVPVLCLCQLNRDVEKRTGKDRRPRLADLRESGAIEQDADIVMFVDRPAVYDEESQQHEAKVYITKHRSGETGTVDLDWDGATTSFHNVEQSSGSFFGVSE